MTVSVKLDGINLAYRTRAGFFRYSESSILNDINLEIHQGETIGVIGRNGCGKSSLLRLISGHLSADSGTIDRISEKIFLQTLNSGLDRQLSGYDNARLCLTLYGIIEGQEQKIQQILEFAELGDYFFKPIKSYSTGMKARLSFAISLMNQADVILIDETLGVGDLNFRIKAEKEIQNKVKSSCTVVVVSHSVRQLNRICNRVLWLHEGSIRRLGKPSEVLTEYENFLTNKNNK